MPQITGSLEKMHSVVGDTVEYALRVGEKHIPLNPLINQSLKISSGDKIFCLYCQKPTKKSYSQGYCYVCSQQLARCDMCILKPELCHFHQGTCREPEWGQTHCMIPHYVYLANTSGLKVGITRHTQIPTRWVDQGAIQALPIFKTQSRRVAGYLEVALARYISDKTNWRALLKSRGTLLDLEKEKCALLQQTASALEEIRKTFSADSFDVLEEAVVDLQYPVMEYPAKVTSIGLDKQPIIEGTLTGIKGQYLYFGDKVFNVRKHTSYTVTVEY